MLVSSDLRRTISLAALAAAAAVCAAVAFSTIAPRTFRHPRQVQRFKGREVDRRVTRSTRMNSFIAQKVKLNVERVNGEEVKKGNKNVEIVKG